MAKSTPAPDGDDEFEMCEAGDSYGPKPDLPKHWVGVPEVTKANGRKAAYFASQITAADAGKMIAERRVYDDNGRFVRVDDTRDAERELAWKLRDGKGRRSWADTDAALAVMADWPEEVVDRLVREVRNAGRVNPPADDASAEGNSGQTQTG